MNNTKEIYEVFEMFEKDAPMLPSHVPANFEREPYPLWKKGAYYSNGAVNDYFIVYLRGYSFGKAVGRMEL
jgi:hypothetical protein